MKTAAPCSRLHTLASHRGQAGPFSKPHHWLSYWLPSTGHHRLYLQRSWKSKNHHALGPEEEGESGFEATLGPATCLCPLGAGVTGKTGPSLAWSGTVLGLGAQEGSGYLPSCQLRATTQTCPEVGACGQEGSIGRQSPAPERMGMRLGQGLP